MITIQGLLTSATSGMSELSDADFHTYVDRYDMKSETSPAPHLATQSVKSTENPLPKSNGGLKLPCRRQPSRYESYGSIFASDCGRGIFPSRMGGASMLRATLLEREQERASSGDDDSIAANATLDPLVRIDLGIDSWGRSGAPE